MKIERHVDDRRRLPTFKTLMLREASPVAGVAMQGLLRIILLNAFMRAKVLDFAPKKFLFTLATTAILFSCSKSGDSSSPPLPPEDFRFTSVTVDGISGTNNYFYQSVKINPVIKLAFTVPVSLASAASFISLTDQHSVSAPLQYSYASPSDSATVVVQSKSNLQNIQSYVLKVLPDLQSQRGTKLNNTITVNLLTKIDSTDKFVRISDSALLDLIQQQTLKYFTDFAHPVSGMARERNTSGDIVTTGGTGFGIMAIIAAANRNFMARSSGVAQIQKIVSFLKTADRFHGAFPHWLNGGTGKVVPFSTKDDGADLVETAFLMQGLLTARQYFNQTGNEEKTLRTDIDSLWRNVEWSWFRKDAGNGPENVLYWHWSPDYAWDMNLPIRGWNEALMPYILAASSPTHGIPKVVYDNGWAQDGAMKNGKTFLGYQLPLGPDYGGPLFFSHYSFLGINPDGLKDVYTDYWQQNKNHTMINYNYCFTNSKNFFGYSSSCWGLTASDDNKQGYLAHSPTNDNGVISPTAALSAMPYAPAESMAALRFFYYTLGDKLWKEYGFIDAFSLNDAWFANSFLAIDQGPIIVMIENYRSKLLWNLFMSCPEIKNGMAALGFQSPHL